MLLLKVIPNDDCTKERKEEEREDGGSKGGKERVERRRVKEKEERRTGESGEEESKSKEKSVRRERVREREREREIKLVIYTYIYTCTPHVSLYHEVIKVSVVWKPSTTIRVVVSSIGDFAYPTIMLVQWYMVTKNKRTTQVIRATFILGELWSWSSTN